ncbi:MAG: HAMP domain-containing sensor histidine kinase [Brevinematia bacterium]
MNELLEVLSVGSKLSEIFQKISVIFSIKFGTKNFFFGNQREIIYGFGNKSTKHILNLIRETQEQINYKDVECVMKLNNYFLYFDINSFTSKEEIILSYAIIDNFLKNHEKFETIYTRFKYLKALVFSIEPLIYEISIKNALSHSLISLTTFTDIDKAIIAILSNKRMEVVSAIGIEKEILKNKEILINIKKILSGEKEIFLNIATSQNNKHRLVGIVPLREFNETKGILLVEFKETKESVTEIDKEILKILSFVMTHRIKLYEMNINLIRAKKRAEELSRLKSEFVANVSHELRTPLNAILGFVELLKMGDFPKSEQDKYLDYIMFAGTSLLGMINNILDLSKIEAGAMKPIFTRIQVKEISEELERYGKVLSKNKNIDFYIENNTGDMTINTDYMMIKSILVNLISNAVKFTEKGWVKVSIYTKPNNVIFKIEDTGIGMKESDLKKIFTPFTQLENVRNKRFSGTGIGLSLSKKFADMLNAKIIPKTKGVGKGCIFYVVLPT